MSLLVFASATAEIYKWKDKDGNIQFGDRPPATAKTKRVELKINTYKSVEEGYSPDWFYKRKKSRGGGRQQVVMYSAVWCGICTRAKKYFKKNNIAFKELDIDTSKEGKEGFKRLNGTGVPIILVGKKRMNGFDSQRFEKMYRGEQSQ